jgi:hypothetical protein
MQEMRMIELESMAVEMPEVKGHPNRVGFRGVLTVVDAASQRAPAGSNGRRVLLTRAAAETALPSLLGMALDYAPSFDRHDVRRKVGVITSAEIVGRQLEVGGYLYAKDFPEVVKEVEKWGGKAFTTGDTGTSPLLGRNGAPGRTLRAALAEAVESLRELTAGRKAQPVIEARVELAAAGAGPLGMSFELTNVVVADRRTRVWILTQVMFTGAAILRRSAAAYDQTWIGLSES